MISTMEHPKKKIEVLGYTMAYVEIGEGDPIVFLHGNPTSSYLWRNIMPHLAKSSRCIAPDLIGMGDSDKLSESGPDRYRFLEHRCYLDEFLKMLGISENVILVTHDWGSALGLDWARRYPDAIRGIAYMEGIVRPVTWEEWNPDARPLFEGFRSPAGETMVLEKNIFVERVLPGSVMRNMTETEMRIYRKPFSRPGEDRRPTLTWPREIPISGEPADVVSIVQDYADWMAENDLPKLFVNADPGAILIGKQREFCRGWKNQQEVTVAGVHFIQEDSPDEIGLAISAWHQKIH